MITRPCTSCACNVLRKIKQGNRGPHIRRHDCRRVRRAVGPSPFLMTVTGIITEPPGRIVAAIGETQETMLDAGGRKIDRRRDGGWAAVRYRSCHSILDEQLARYVGEAFDAGVRDQDALGDLQPHRFQPQPCHEMKCHARFQLGPVAGAQAHGALAPIRRIGNTDAVAGAVVLDDAVFLQDCEEAIGDVLAGIARLCGCKSGLHCLRALPFPHRESPASACRERRVRDNGTWYRL